MSSSARTTSMLERLPRPSARRPRAIMLAHTLGEPVRSRWACMAVAKEHDLWLIEDTCDAVGATYRRPIRRHRSAMSRPSASTRPTMSRWARAGAVLTNSQAVRRVARVVPRLGPGLLVAPAVRQHLRQTFRLAVPRPSPRLRPQVRLLAHRLQPESHRHAGRRRSRPTGEARTGLSRQRNANWAYLRAGMADLEDVFVLPVATEGSEPSWFGFCVTIRPGAPFGRLEFVRYLEDRGVATTATLRREPAAATGIQGCLRAGGGSARRTRT